MALKPALTEQALHPTHRCPPHGTVLTNIEGHESFTAGNAVIMQPRSDPGFQERTLAGPPTQRTFTHFARPSKGLRLCLPKLGLRPITQVNLTPMRLS